MILQKAKYKVNSRYDGYWYYVFTELTEELKERLNVRFIEKAEYWVKKIGKEDIEKWLEK